MVCSVSRNARSLKGVLREGLVLPKVLMGVYPATQMAKMSSIRLERLVTQLILCTSECVREKTKKPVWWPKKLDFRQPISDLKMKSCNDMTWCKLLKQLVVVCSKFYGEKSVATRLEWRLPVVPPPNKTPKLDENNQNSANQNKNRKLRSSKIKKTFKSDILCRRKPFVRLYDILKTPVKSEEVEVSQHQFLKGFGLVNTTQSLPITNEKPVITKVTSGARLAQLTQVPFSSDYGRTLLKRERQLDSEIHVKRLERLEWYLKNPTMPAALEEGLTYPVTYVPRNDGQHVYKFPKRQCYQGSGGFSTAFLLSLCKPVCVRLVEGSRIHKENGRLGTNTKELKVVLKRLSCEETVAKNNIESVVRRLRPKRALVS